MNPVYGIRHWIVGTNPSLDICCLHDNSSNTNANGYEKWLKCNYCGSIVDKITVDSTENNVRGNE